MVPAAGLPAALLVFGLRLPGATASASVQGHLFQEDQCGSCHLFPSRDGAFLRDDAFRRDIASLCLACHERERGGIGHRVGMVPSMRIPADMPLDAAGRLTCASCHDPHAVDGPNRWLLRRPPGAPLCRACHPDGMPEREPPAVAFTFPPEGAVIAAGQTVVAGTVANRSLVEVRVSTGRETFAAPVVRGGFVARVRLAPGATTVTVAAGGREVPLRLVARPASATWTPHLTNDAAQCAVCHPGWERDGFFVGMAPGETCQRCHARVDTLPRRHEPAALGECTACHDPHGTPSARAARRDGERCGTCHDPAAAARHLYESNIGRASAITACGDCHDPHQSTRPALTTAVAASLALPLALEAPAPSLRVGRGGAADVALTGFGLTDDAGRPQLPERIVTLAVPPGADPGTARLRILEADAAELPGRHAVAPAPPAATFVDGTMITEWGGSRKVRDGRDLAVYETDAPWPPAPLALERPSALGDVALVRVAFRPLQYRPATGALTHTRRVVAEVEFEPAPAGTAESARRAPRAAAATADELQIANAGRARSWSVEAKRSASRLRTAAGRESAAAAIESDGTPQAAYLVVTTKATAAASAVLAEFAAHKASRGLPVRIATEDDFGAAAAGRQRANAIREWLRANASALGARYLLLVGDPTPESGDVPMLRAWPRRGATTNTTYLDAPTDAFYADLSGSWDLDADGYPGEFRHDGGPGGVDFVPELFVGRIPVYGGDVATLDAILRKVIAYETDPGDLSWRRSALLPMSFSDAYTDGAWLAEQMKGDYLLGRGFSPWSLYQEGSAGGAASVFTPDAELRGGTAAERWAAVPYGVVAYWGHGSATRTLVGYTGAWDGDLLVAPTAALNDATPAFVYETACLNGYPETDANLAYQLLKNGAIATVAASRVSWYAVGQQDFRLSTSNAGLGYRYLSLLTAGEAAGRALALAKGDPALGAVSDTAWMNFMDFNLYGDPSVGLFPGPVLQASPGSIALVAAEGEEDALTEGLVLSAGDAAIGVQAQAGAAWLGGVPLDVQTPATLALTAAPGGLP
ncbi:MAG TPA: C25 family cysteine peptidase, partial [bacterium]